MSFTADDSPSSGVAQVTLWYNYEEQGWTDSGLFESGTSGSIDFAPGDGDGSYEFYTVATDNAGNVEAAPGAADDSTVYDTVAPVSSCTSPEYANSSPIAVSFTADDSPSSGVAQVTLWYNYEEQGWTDSGLFESGTSGSIDFAPGDGDGSYEFYTVATDNAGNVEAAPGAADDSTVYDTVAPVSSCDSPTLTNSAEVVVTYEASDAGSGVETVGLRYKFGHAGTWTNTGLASSNASGQLTFIATLGDGAYYFATVAGDNAGNTEAGPSGDGDTSTMVDTTPPWSSADSPSNVSDLPISVDYSSGDSGSGLSQTQLYYRYEAGDWLVYGDAVTAPEETIDFYAPDGAGTYDFFTLATDNAGNVEAPPSSPDSTTVYSPVGQPSIGVSPSSLDFGDVLVGQSETLTVEVSNRGDAMLELPNAPNVNCPNANVEVVISSRSAVSYSRSADAWASIAPDGSIVLQVTLTPSAAAEIAGTMTITSNDPNNPAVEVDISAMGTTAGELSMSISSDKTDYEFGDSVDVTVGAVNDGSTVEADIYVLLVFDFGGAGHRFWSPVGFDAWTEGIQRWLTSFELPHGLDTSLPVWSLPVPNDVPNLALSGDYTLLIGATDPGTFDFISDIAEWGFSVHGSPFIMLNADADSYGLGDTLSIGVAVSAPGYDVFGDVYLVVLDPDGAFWSPVGESWAWTSGLEAFMPSFDLPAGLELTLDGLWQIPITGESPPFNRYGDYLLMAGITECDALTLWCDIGVDAFNID